MSSNTDTVCVGTVVRTSRTVSFSTLTAKQGSGVRTHTTSSTTISASARAARSAAVATHRSAFTYTAHECVVPPTARILPNQLDVLRRVTRVVHEVRISQ